jgi:glutamate carboxypeptidase
MTTPVTTGELAERLTGRLDELAARVIALAEINSGSYNPDGVDRVGQRLAEMTADLDPDTVEQVAVDPSPVITTDGTRSTIDVGRALRVTKRGDAPVRLLVFGHLDTVFGPDDPFQAVRAEGHRLAGPGVADCKGGLILAVEMLAYLDRTDWGRSIGWELLVLPDEEIGSIGSKPLLRQAANRAHFGIGVEPALPSGGVAAARKGSLTGHLMVSGAAAHVGRAHHEGRSAILELSRLITELEAHNERSGVTVNCGRISGGGALNVVPDSATASFNMRVETAADQRWIESAFERAVEGGVARSGCEIDLVWTGSRPPKERTPELDRMLGDVTEAASALGVDIEPEDTGGCCDGNDLAAAGLVNVDSLGIAGGGIHSSGEFAHVDSIPARAAVVAEVVRRAAGRVVERGT